MIGSILVYSVSFAHWQTAILMMIIGALVHSEGLIIACSPAHSIPS